MLSKKTLPFITIILYFGMQLLTVFFALYVAASNGFDLVDLANGNNPEEYAFVNSIASILGYGVSTLALVVLSYRFFGKEFKKSKLDIFAYAAVGFIALFAVNFIITNFMNLIGVQDQPDNQAAWDLMFANADTTIKIGLILTTVVFAPIFEEMVFRYSLFQFVKQLFSSLSPKAIGVIQIVFTSFLFGAIHVTSDFIYILYYMPMGLVMGYIYYKSDNILYSTLLHVSYNLVGVIAMLGL